MNTSIGARRLKPSPRVGFAEGDEPVDSRYSGVAPTMKTIADQALGSSTDGEEITQELSVSAWRAGATHQPEKGSLSGWLVGIAVTVLSTGSGVAAVPAARQA